MNILYLSSRFGKGYFGMEKCLDNLVHNLPLHSHTFIGKDPCNAIFDNPKSDRINDRIKQHIWYGGFEATGWKKKLVSPIFFITTLLSTIVFAKDFKRADIIVLPASILGESVYLNWYFQIFHKKVVQIIHLNDCPDYIVHNPFIKLALNTWNNGTMVFVSQSQKSLWQAKNLVSKNSPVIYSGIIIGDQPNHKTLDSNNLKIGFVGRLHNDKGLDILLRALSQLDLDDKKIKLKVEIAGEGEHKDQILQVYQSLSFDSRITIEFLDFQSNVASFVESQDLIVYPSRLESFGLVVVESYERGIPVLTSNLDCFEEIKSFTNNIERELVFESENVVDLQSKLLMFVNNPTRYISENQLAILRQSVIDNFGIEQSTAKYEQLFLSL